MKLLKVFLLISIFALVSCSNNKKKATAKKAEDAALEMEDESDFIVDSDEEDLELSSDSEATEMMATDETVILDGENNATSISMTDAVGEYTVQKGDTMMLIAFKLYGDYRKWKTLKDMNPSMDRLVEGAVLKYSEPSEKFVWSPEGLPHLIQDGETLGTISNSKYGTVTKWKLLYENNRPMILDPNLIFAGFTLYYVPERDVASE
jgi:nucleoid-associated protein YgaU